MISNDKVQSNSRVGESLRMIPNKFSHSIRMSWKFLSFYNKLIDAQHFSFYIVSLNYV